MSTNTPTIYKYTITVEVEVSQEVVEYVTQNHTDPMSKQLCMQDALTSKAYTSLMDYVDKMKEMKEFWNNFSPRM